MTQGRIPTPPSSPAPSSSSACPRPGAPAQSCYTMDLDFFDSYSITACRIDCEAALQWRAVTAHGAHAR